MLQRGDWVSVPGIRKAWVDGYVFGIAYNGRVWVWRRDDKDERWEPALIDAASVRKLGKLTAHGQLPTWKGRAWRPA